MQDYEIELTGEGTIEFDDFSIKGYLLKTVQSESNAFIARKTVSAANWRDALNEFNSGLFPIFDAISYHQNGAISGYGVSTLISRQGSSVSLVFLIDKGPGIGTWLDNGAIPVKNEIERLIEVDDPAVELYRHVLLSTGAKSVAANLLPCIEALAGAKPQSVKCASCRRTLKCASCGETHKPNMTNRAKVKEIIGDELYRHYFEPLQGQEKSIRNQLAHGDPVDERVVNEKIQDLTGKAREAINEKYHLVHARNRVAVGLLQFGQYAFLVERTESIPLPYSSALLGLIKTNQLTSESSPYKIVEPTEELNLDNY